MNGRNRVFGIVAVVAIVIALAAAAGAGIALRGATGGGTTFGAQAADYGCQVYREQGCAKLVVATGGAVVIEAGGALAITPGATVNIGAAEAHAGVNTFSGAVKVVATPASTQTPQFLIQDVGAGNPFEIRNSGGTPVVQVQDAGTVQKGYFISYDLYGRKIVCNSQVITGTGTLAHGLATPVWVIPSMAQDVVGDCTHLSYTNAAATVTVKCWNSALTPAAGVAGTTVQWCVIGMP